MKIASIIRAAPHVFIIGNGGSHANAIHLANDLLACGVKAFTMDSATLTATANDWGYQYVFERWISVVGSEGDILLALSGSGKSVNINRAVRRAKTKNMTIIGLTGAFTLPHNTLARAAHYVVVRGRTMQEAENYQLVWGHKMMRWLRRNENV